MTPKPILATSGYTAKAGNRTWAASIWREGEDIPGYEHLVTLPKGYFYRLSPISPNGITYSDILWSLEIWKLGGNRVTRFYISPSPVTGLVEVVPYFAKRANDIFKHRKRELKYRLRYRKRQRAILYEYQPTAESPRGKKLLWRRAVLGVTEYFTKWGVIFGGFTVAQSGFYAAFGDEHWLSKLWSSGIGFGTFFLAQVLMQRGVVVPEEGLSLRRVFAPVTDFLINVGLSIFYAFQDAWEALKGGLRGMPAALVKMWKGLFS